MKMRSSIRGSLFFAWPCLLAAISMQAQQAPKAAPQSQLSTDLAVTWSPERAELAPGACGCFWLEGGSADAAVTFFKGFGAAASFSGGHASNVTPGVAVNKIAFTAGPRFTYILPSHAADRHRLQIFGQGLFGYAHGFSGVYPDSNGASSSASSLAVETGGGLDLFLTRDLGLRLLQAEYVRTALPNNASNTQNDLQLSFGFVLHLGGGDFSRH